MTERTHLNRALKYVLAPSNPTHRPVEGETLESLDDLAQCARVAGNRARLRHGSSIERLLHVADHDVPRLLTEIIVLREALTGCERELSTCRDERAVLEGLYVDALQRLQEEQDQ